MKNISGSPAQDLKSAIRDKLKGKIAIAGIGNIIRGDDGLGPKFIEVMRSKSTMSGLFDCGTAPENYIIPILSTSCDTVVLVDAADMGIEAGGIRIFDLEEISNVSFSTHNPSPRLFTDLLKTGKDDLYIFVVSIQPKTTVLGAPISEEVLRGINILADLFLEALNG
ncbi:MAG: hydrogenase maturation protease [Candidatus Omnitrophota bacterium]